MASRPPARLRVVSGPPRLGLELDGAAAAVGAATDALPSRGPIERAPQRRLCENPHGNWDLRPANGRLASIGVQYPTRGTDGSAVPVAAPGSRPGNTDFNRW